MAVVLSAGGDTTFEFNERLIQDGLLLSLIGMGVVFVVLSVLAVSIKVFDRIDSLIPAETTAGAASPAKPPAPASSTPAKSVPGSDDSKTAAIIAVALALAEAENRASNSAGARPVQQSASGSWVSTGRSREMANRLSGLPNRGRRNS